MAVVTEEKRAIARAAHQWFENNLDAGCEGHVAHPPPMCEDLTAAIVREVFEAPP